MKPTLWHRLDNIARRWTPFLLTLALVLIGLLPLHIPGFARVVPMLPLIAVYHWAVYRPEWLPVQAVFLIGLLQDILSGAPLGVNALVYLIVYGVVVSQDRFFVGKSFLIVWVGFALVAAGAEAVSWLLISLYNVTVIEPQAAAYQYLMTLGSFPLIAWLFMRWQRAVLR